MATNNTGLIVASCLAAFIAWILAAQYAPILHALPYLFVSGVVFGILATFLFQTLGARKEISQQSADFLPAASSLEVSRPRSFTRETEALKLRRTHRSLTIAGTAPALSEALTKLLDLIVRDNVQGWLSKITESRLFASEVLRALRATITELAACLSNKDLVRLVVVYAVPIFNDHFEDFLCAESEVQASVKPQLASDEAANVEIAAKYRAGSLHPAASLANAKSSGPQHRHLRTLVEELVLPRLAAGLLQNPAVRVISREIVACGVLSPIIQMMSDPDFVFQQIETHGRALLIEYNVGQEQNDTRAVVPRRLSDPAIATNAKSMPSQPQPLNDRQPPGLHETLYDVAGLSYFMEFMDRFHLVCYIQFWITADGFQTSLEKSDRASRTHPLENSHTSWTEADEQMMQRLLDRFLRNPAISRLAKDVSAVEAFLDAGAPPTASRYRAARQAILESQNNVFREMEREHFPKFQTSEAYLQWIGFDPTERSARVFQPMQHQSGTFKKPLPKNTDQQALARTSLSTDNLRGSANQSGSLSRDARKMALLSATRRSLDEDRGRKPLFAHDADSDDGALAASTARFDNASSRHSEIRQTGKDAEMKSESRPRRPSFGANEGLRSSSEAHLQTLHASQLQRSSNSFDKPSLDSLGLLGTPSKRTVFTTDDLFGEKSELWEDDDTHSQASNDGEEVVREAKPGDLGLPEAIEALSIDIEKLEAQQSILQSLTSKAELTNDSAELKILRKSTSALEREVRRRELQRQQFIIQASDHNLYRKANVFITSVHVGKEHDGHEFAIYDVNVQRSAFDNMPKASWKIAKRYSEFHDFHRRIRTRFPNVRDVPFPKRQVVPTLHNDFVQRRRATLEQYLRFLLRDNNICQSLELRAFLSEQPIRSPRQHRLSVASARRDTIHRLYATLSQGLEDFQGNGHVLDQLSFAGQNLISAVTSASGIPIRLEDPSSHSTSSLSADAVAQPVLAVGDPRTSAEAQAEIAAFGRTSHVTTSSEASTRGASTHRPGNVAFIEPIARGFSALFLTNASNNWLRGRAVVIVLQQLLGGTVERRTREIFRSLTTAASLAGYIDNIRNALWPNGQARPTPPERSKAAKARTRRDAEEVLSALIVQNAGSIVGRSAARDAAKRLIRCLSNGRLNQHLIYTILDEMTPVLLLPGDGTEDDFSARLAGSSSPLNMKSTLGTGYGGSKTG